MSPAGVLFQLKVASNKARGGRYVIPECFLQLDTANGLLSARAKAFLLRKPTWIKHSTTGGSDHSCSG